MLYIDSECDLLVPSRPDCRHDEVDVLVCLGKLPVITNRQIDGHVQCFRFSVVFNNGT